MSREQLKDRIRRNLEKTNAKAFCHLSQTHDKRRTIPKGMFEGSRKSASKDLITMLWSWGLTRMTAIMEVGCDVTQKEERISSKIARKEDEEQLRLIMEEESLQRWPRRMKKKLKHG
ncbi:hypothetical protein C4D60_Mb09t09530 [Musa balbisiana]|uniref:Uncharacterized protein n=1 Tax=Musa balbisiana TaxID=52838 RepID=A0A4S8IGI0_MUSBA|nr:hypothetical protein C4D60_Mb09t09530 [Musa balbisiana]